MLLKEAKPPLDFQISSVWHIDCGTEKFFAAAAGKEVVLYVDEIGASSLENAATFNKNKLGTKWHDAAITVVKFCQPNLLCTGALDGSICIVDIESETLLFRIKSDKGPNSAIKGLDVAFENEENGKVLISLNEAGLLGAWSLATGTNLDLELDPQLLVNFEAALVTSICVKSSENLLIIGDSAGSVSVCPLRGRPLSIGPATRWKAYAKPISSLDYADKHGLVISTSNDTIKLWTRQGKLTGTFGERLPWDLERRKHHFELHVSDESEAKTTELPGVEAAPANIQPVEEHVESVEEERPHTVDVIGSLAHIARPIDSKALYHSMQIYPVSTKFASSRIPSIFQIPNVE
jgi:hypothetical protein